THPYFAKVFLGVPGLATFELSDYRTAMGTGNIFPKSLAHALVTQVISVGLWNEMLVEGLGRRFVEQGFVFDRKSTEFGYSMFRQNARDIYRSSMILPNRAAHQIELPNLRIAFWPHVKILPEEPMQGPLTDTSCLSKRHNMDLTISSKTLQDRRHYFFGPFIKTTPLADRIGQNPVQDSKQ